MTKEEQVKVPGGGASGFFKRIWYFIKLAWIGFKANLVELFTPHRKFDLKKEPRRPGEVAVITGGARGIGLEVIKKLLILDMHVIMGCRNEATGQEAIAGIRKKHGISTGTTEVIPLDLMSLDSVRKFGGRILVKYPKLHILFNNAGIMASPYKITVDGYESQFQVNYLSHFLLTNLLLPRLITSGRPGKASRVVNVSSVAHYGGFINFDDINMQQMYSPEMAYMQSKLMSVITTRDLNARLAQNEGLRVNVFAVHPGIVMTDLYEHMGIASLCGCIFRLIYKTPVQGADGVLFAGLSSKLEGEGGLYFANCKKNSVNKLAKDEATQKQLWDLSCKLTHWIDLPVMEMVRKGLPTKKGHTAAAAVHSLEGNEVLKTQSSNVNNTSLDEQHSTTTVDVDSNNPPSHNSSPNAEIPPDVVLQPQSTISEGDKDVLLLTASVNHSKEAEVEVKSRKISSIQTIHQNDHVNITITVESCSETSSLNVLLDDEQMIEEIVAEAESPDYNSDSSSRSDHSTETVVSIVKEIRTEDEISAFYQKQDTTSSVASESELISQKHQTSDDIQTVSSPVFIGNSTEDSSCTISSDNTVMVELSHQ